MQHRLRNRIFMQQPRLMPDVSPDVDVKPDLTLGVS